MTGRFSRVFGGRSFGLLVCLVVTLFAGCQSLRLPYPMRQGEGDWLTEGGGPSRQYARDVHLAPPLELAWKYNAGGGFGPGSPLILDGAVLVSTRKGEVHAIDLNTGKGRGVAGFGESVDGTPVVDDRGILYVPVSWGRRGLVAYDLSRGTTMWKQQRVPVEAGLLLMNGLLIAADVQSRILVYDAQVGELLWETALSDRAVVHAAPVQIGPETFLVADDEGVATAFNTENGDVVWESVLPGPVYNPPASAHGLVFIPTTRGKLVALDVRDGTEVFAFDAGHSEVRLSTPAISDSLFVVAGSNGVLFGANASTGELAWSHASGEAFSGAPLIAGETVYAADMAETLRAFELQTGRLMWETELDGRVKSAMAADNDGLIVLAEPRTVMYFKSTNRDVASR